MGGHKCKREVRLVNVDPVKRDSKIKDLTIYTNSVLYVENMAGHLHDSIPSLSGEFVG